MGGGLWGRGGGVHLGTFGTLTFSDETFRTLTYSCEIDLVVSLDQSTLAKKSGKCRRNWMRKQANFFPLMSP